MITDDLIGTQTETESEADRRTYGTGPWADPSPPAAEEPAAPDRYTVFQQRRRGLKLGDFGVVLPAGTVYEIIESANISPMPGVTGLFKGFVNHRGTVAPVYDLAELTDSDPGTWERRRLLILNSGAEAVAVKLYELPVPVRNEYGVPDTFLDKVPDSFRRHTQQVYRAGDQLWLDIDLDAFFDTLSRLCLKADRPDDN